MSPSKKSLLFLSFFFSLAPLSADIQLIDSVDFLQLSRVAAPDSAHVAKERTKADQRLLKKHVVTAAVVVAVIAGFVLACEMSERDRKNKDELSKKDWVLADAARKASASKTPTPVEPEGWFSWAMTKTQSFGSSFAGMIGSSAQLLVAGIVTNAAWSYVQNKISQAYQDETMLWYAHNQTKIPQLFNDLKSYAVDYDLYSSLLSAELFNQDAQLHMKAFVADLIGSAQDYMKEEIFKDPHYFAFLLDEMKKKYTRKSNELEKLQEYVVPMVGKRHRALAQNHMELLFADDMGRRKDIAQMCDTLAVDMEKLMAFALMRGPRQKGRIMDMVASCNDFLVHMEMLLNATPEKLAELSKADRGMFTCIYEYEKLFGEQVNFLHRYCKLIH